MAKSSKRSRAARKRLFAAQDQGSTVEIPKKNSRQGSPHMYADADAFADLSLSTDPVSTACHIPSPSADSGMALPALENDTTDIVAELLQIEATFTYFCIRQHKLTNVKPANLRTRCERCSMYCKNSLLTRVLTCAILVRDADKNLHDYTLDNTLIQSLVPFYEQAPNQRDYIVKQIMQHNTICITSRGKQVIAASFCQDDPIPGTSAQPGKHSTLDQNQTDAFPVPSIPISTDTYYYD